MFFVCFFPQHVPSDQGGSKVMVAAVAVVHVHLLHSAVPSYVLLCLVVPHTALLCRELLQRTATNHYF
ncbi:hypothetical protein FQN60_009895, partial [Etheostoma spectabile]